MKNIYIAGPMTGIPQFNFGEFYKAQAHFEALGYNVFNPAEKDNEKHGEEFGWNSPDGDPKTIADKYGFNLRETLGMDLEFICKEADAIYMLKGWEKSSGANAEHKTAIALGLEIIYQ